MNKRLIITSSVALALIGGAVFATTRPALYTTQGQQIQPAGLVAPSNKPVETQPATTPPETPQPTAQVEATVSAPVLETATVQAEVPAPAQPAAVTPPRTVTNVIGANVNGNARAGIDTFTCIYHFSDGTSESRETQYTPVPSSMPAALCPEWE